MLLYLAGKGVVSRDCGGFAFQPPKIPISLFVLSMLAENHAALSYLESTLIGPLVSVENK
jgi:hypothetical protein